MKKTNNPEVTCTDAQTLKGSSKTTKMQKIQLTSLFLIVIILQATAERKRDLLTSAHCPPVAEGSNGMITFSFEEQVASSIKIIFVKKNNGPDLLRCIHNGQETSSRCISFSESHKTDGLVDGNLTIVISNASKAHQGVYVLHSFSTDSSLDPISCHFNISHGGDNTEQNGTGGISSASLIAAGFIVLLIIALIFFVLYIRRKRNNYKPNGEKGRKKGHDPDIIERGKEESDHTPEVQVPLLSNKSDPNSTTVNQDEAGRDTSSDRKSQEKEKHQSGTLPSQSTDSAVVPQYTPAIVVGIEGVKSPNSKLSSCEEHPKSHRQTPNTGPEKAAHCVKSAKDNEGDEGIASESKIGYFKHGITRKAERDLLKDNVDGSFLIRPSWSDPHKTLAVKVGGKVEHFTIIQSGDNFELQDTGNNFKSLAELVKYYTENTIKTVENQTFGKLSQPCPHTPGKDPKCKEPSAPNRPTSPRCPQEAAGGFTSTTENHSDKGPAPPGNIGYFEDVTTAEVEKELVKSNGEGSFLIRPGWDDRHKILAVNVHGLCMRVPILHTENGVVFQDTGKVFKSVSDLVEYYKINDIKTVKGQIIGKLSHPCVRVPKETPKGGEPQVQNRPASPTGPQEADPGFRRENRSSKDPTPASKVGYFEDVTTVTAEKELLKRNGLGSFLIRQDCDDRHKILAVNFYGASERFSIVHTENIVLFEDTGKSFKSLSDLVEYYRNNAIVTVKGRRFGKLSHPCIRVPGRV